LITFAKIYPLKLISLSRIGYTLVLSSLLLLSACTHIDLFEKTVAVPGHAWKSDFSPSFSFTIKDSTPQRIFLILRHDEKYDFNNIIVNLDIKSDKADSADHQSFDLPLTAADKGWTGTGMDDIYEHRISLINTHAPGKGESILDWYLSPGTYTFTLKQNMREDPLQHVYNVGIRVEKPNVK